jgi:hypothetical protein
VRNKNLDGILSTKVSVIYHKDLHIHNMYIAKKDIREVPHNWMHHLTE